MADIDYDKIQRQLGILMSNSTAFTSKMYDLFVSTTPMDVEFQVWTSENSIETLLIPNRAKGNIPAQYGVGSPDGNVEANYGTIYLDQSDGKVYIKTTLDGASGWLEIITSAGMNEHNNDTNAHVDTLAKIHGDPDTEFSCKDIDDSSDDTFAVNKGSLFKLLGGLNNLDTEDKSTIVDAINETVEMNMYDCGCVVRVSASAIDRISNVARLLTVESASDGSYKIRVKDTFIIMTADGRKYTVPSVTIDTSTFNVSLDGKTKYAIFASLEPSDVIKNDDGTTTAGLVAYPGNFYVSVHKPYLMQEHDTWLDIGNTPYTLYIKYRNSKTGHLELEDREYVYLGTAEEVR